MFGLQNVMSLPFQIGGRARELPAYERRLQLVSLILIPPALTTLAGVYQVASELGRAFERKQSIEPLIAKEGD